MSATPRALESPSDVHAELVQRITEDGLNPSCSEEEKLFYVWKLLQQTEVDLHASITSEEKLRQAQATEMHEVENYVEHIRHLSDEREALIQELESENDGLKIELQQYKKGIPTTETKDMLTQQGLDEIAQSTTNEQIAFFLVERARLMDELEAVEQNNRSNMSDLSVVASEQDKDGMKAECERLQGELKQAENKIQALEEDVKGANKHLGEVQQELDKQKEMANSALMSPVSKVRPVSPARTNSDLALRKIITEKTQIESEMLNLKGQIKPLEMEKEILNNKIKSLAEELEKAKAYQQGLQFKNKKLLDELDEGESHTGELEKLLSKVKKECADLEDELSSQRDDDHHVQQQSQHRVQQLQEEVDEMIRSKALLKSEIESLKQGMKDKADQHLSEMTIVIGEKATLSERGNELDLRLEELSHSQREQLITLERKLEAVINERETLSTELQEAEAKVKEAFKRDQNKEKQQEAQDVKFKSAENQYQTELSDLKVKLQVTLEEFTRTRDTLEVAKEDKYCLEMKIEDLEQNLIDQRTDQECVCEALNLKVQSLESKLQSFQEELFQSQEELQTSQDKSYLHQCSIQNDKQKLEEDLADITEEKNTLSGQYLEQKTLHANEIHRLQKITQESQKRLQSLQEQVESANELRLSVENKLEQVQRKLKEDGIVSEQGSKLWQEEKTALQASVKRMESTMQKEKENHSTSQIALQKECDTLKEKLDDLEDGMMRRENEVKHQKHHAQSLEEWTGQLEQDNRELAKQLTEKINQCQQLDDILKKEKDRTTVLAMPRPSLAKLHPDLTRAGIDQYLNLLNINFQKTIQKLHSNKSQMELVYQEVELSNEKVRQLRDDLQNKQALINKLDMDLVSQEAKQEGALHKLHLELNESQLDQKRTLDSMSDRHEIMQKENRELRGQLNSKEQLMVQFNNQITRSEAQLEHLETQVQAEQKLRAETISQRMSAEVDVQKAWEQVKILTEKNKNLENIRRTLQDDLERSKSVKASYATLEEKCTSQESALKVSKKRVEMSEQKVHTLESQLDEAYAKLQTAESRMFSRSWSSESNVDLQKNYQETRIQKAILEQTVNELKQQVTMLKSHEEKLTNQNREMQHKMLDMETKISNLREKSRDAFETSQKAEHGRRSMTDQISHFQSEVQNLQYELLSANEKKDLWERRYEQRKLRTKSKLLKAREMYMGERTRLREQLSKLEEDLQLTRTSLNCELEWRNKMDTSNKKLSRENRDLMSQLTTQEETVRDRTRQLSILQVRMQYLETENSQLQQRLEDMRHYTFSHVRPSSQLGGIVGMTASLPSMEKFPLTSSTNNIVLSGNTADRIRETLPRPLSPVEPQFHSLTLATSGIGNSTSIDSSWDNDNLTDAIALVRGNHSSQPISSDFLTHHGFCSRRRGSLSSDKSFDHD